MLGKMWNKNFLPDGLEKTSSGNSLERGSCGCNYADYWRDPVDAVTVETEPEKLAQITPGSLKAVWVLEGGEKYELSENLGRDITNSGGATIGKDSLNTLVIQGG